MPAIVEMYNRFMGGIDLLDMMTSMCKYNLKLRRWYLYVFWHTVTIALVNAWLLQRRHQEQSGKNAPTPALRKFQAMVAGCLTTVGKKNTGRSLRLGGSQTSPSSEPTRRVATSSPSAQVSELLRFDGIDHLPQHTAERQRQRCKICRSAVHFSYNKCGKCAGPVSVSEQGTQLLSAVPSKISTA